MNTPHRPLLAPTLALAALTGLVTVGCKTTGAAARTGPQAPDWFNKPPKSRSTLYFVGSAAGSADEQTARDLAIQKAMSELTVFCGANIKSDFVSEEIERNGVLTQSLSLTVDVSGDEMTIREAEVAKSTTGAASDGSWDAYALIKWPRAQYEAVMAAKRQRAERALALYLEAEAAVAANQIAEAETKLRETKQILGPMKAQIPLKHPKYSNSALLWEATAALRARIEAIGKERRKVVHVAVLCTREGRSASCPSLREGRVKEVVAAKGLKVSAMTVERTVAEEILTSQSPKGDASLRSAGFVLAVRYAAELLAKEDGFTFVNCGARGVVYDTDANRIVSVHEVKPKKGGHVNFKGALEKSCAKAETDLKSWLPNALAGLK